MSFSAPLHPRTRSGKVSIASSDAVRRVSLSLLVLAFVCMTTACGENHVTNVSTEAEAIEIVDLLKENGFDVDKTEVGEADKKQWSVVIRSGLFGGDDEAAYAMQVMRDNGYPRPTDKGMENAYENQGMFPSESAQRAQRLKELKTEIERQIRLLPNVVRVNVNLVMPEESAWSFNPYAATAGVVVVHKDKAGFTPEQIQHLVARGVPNLKPENVSVTMSQQQARVVPRRDLDVNRRKRMLYAGGVGLIAVLAALAVVFILQMRRGNARLAEADDAEADVQLEALPAATESDAAFDYRWLEEGEGADGETTRAQLPAAARETDDKTGQPTA